MNKVVPTLKLKQTGKKVADLQAVLLHIAKAGTVLPKGQQLNRPLRGLKQDHPKQYFGAATCDAVWAIQNADCLKSTGEVNATIAKSLITALATQKHPTVNH